MSQYRLLSRIARNLRYRPLPCLIGLDVEVTSTDQAAAIVEQRLLREAAHLESRGSPSVDELSIVKYGILDLTFEVPEIAWDAEDKPSPQLLREFGFVVDADQSRAEGLFDPRTDPTCITELDQDIRRGASVLRLFLKECPARDMTAHWLHLIQNRGSMNEFADEFLSTYFPKSFVVADACLTNAPFVWFHKHFWM